MGKIIKVYAKVYNWKGPIQKIHENFCTNASDIINQVQKIIPKMKKQCYFHQMKKNTIGFNYVFKD